MNHTQRIPNDSSNTRSSIKIEGSQIEVKEEEPVASLPDPTSPSISSAPPTPASSTSSKSKKKSKVKKSPYKQQYKKLKQRFKRLIGDNEMLKDKLDSRKSELSWMSRDIHYILERISSYEATKERSRAGDGSSSSSEKGSGEKPSRRGDSEEEEGKTPKRKSDFLPPAECKGAGDSGQVLWGKKGRQKVRAPADSLFIPENAKEPDGSDSSLEIRNERPNGHDTKLHSHVIDPEKGGREANGSIDPSSETSSSDSFGPPATSSMMDKIKTQLSFCIPSDIAIGRNLISLIPEKPPPTLPDDIFSES